MTTGLPGRRRVTSGGRALGVQFRLQLLETLVAGGGELADAIVSSTRTTLP
ncbi:hypothetical protein [Streptomyces sp. NPDC093589]|uniref:hypothetical protein n=1 Tax=Streptomyces sp. NPDC093589 TaxID=3366043 RepID=UPI0037FEC4DC